MKKKIILPLFIGIGIMGYLSSKNLFVDGTTNSLLLSNVEALAITETNTSWICDGSNKKECRMRCGKCNTHVHGTGKTTGSHSCN